jgi:hypothetical protein
MGVGVAVGVLVGVGAGVLVGTGVSFAAAAVIWAISSGDGPQAARPNTSISARIEMRIRLSIRKVLSLSRGVTG